MTISYPQSQNRSAKPVDVALESGALVDVQPPRHGLDIAIRDGKVWITQSGDPIDHVLVAGESFRSFGPGLIVVQALENARVGLP